KWSALCRRRNDALAFQYVDDGRGIQSACATQEYCALQQSHIGLGVHTVAALRALRRDEAQLFPGAKSGRGNPDAARHLADAQQAVSRSNCRWLGEILSA